VIGVGVSPTRIPAGDPADLEVCLTNTGQGTYTNVIFTIRLPAGMMRLRGRDRIEVNRLAPGQSVTSPLRVRADSAGRYELTSANFSYRDHRGQPHRETGFAAEITVDPKRDPLPEPQVTVELQTAELPRDEWSTLRSRIINSGAVGVSDLEIAVSGQATVDQRGARIRLEKLPAGRSVDVSFFVRARQVGAHVPVHLDLAYSDQSRRYRGATTHSIKVIRDQVTPPPATPGSRQPVVKILFLGANPIDTRRLRLDEEMREIQRAIMAGKERDKIDFTDRAAVRPVDISQALLDYEPRIVHFAGHGGGSDGSFAAEDEHGNAYIIPVDGLARLFQAAGRSVECIVVNACSTELLARALSAWVPYVVGMRQPVGDRSAIRFSIGFYQALAAGRPIEDAFDLGVAQLMMMHVGRDQLAPLLLRHGVEG
jgi:uncharacterized repeat protein (TIGR01451 family)